MPDFERIIDRLRLDMAPDPISRSHAEGFIEGKRFARRQALILMLAIGGMFATTMLVAGAAQSTCLSRTASNVHATTDAIAP